ncbi:hypothetical protein CQJ27_15160 [Escherichia sp. E1130]|nr:hypothetical protein CRI66_01605 [Escherichia sp. E4694]TGC24587.1 hypothetical protein CQJ27_15160 [Escherichia sp. E1130]
MRTTIKIPEVLIGEIIRYALRTLSLAPTCADAQVFFSHRLYCRSSSSSRVISPHSHLMNDEQRELKCFLAFFEICALLCTAFA